MSKKTLLFLPALLLSILLFTSCSDTKVPRGVQVEDGYIEVNGTEIYYKRMGEGEPIVVVHGGPVLEHGYLVPYFEDLSRDYELIYFDQRLSGRSSADVDSSDITLQAFINDIEGLRNAFGLDKVHLIGHSWGGFLAMKYAIEHPSNLHSLVLLSAMPASSDLWVKEQIAMAKYITEEDRRDRRSVMNSEAFSKKEPEAIEQLLVLSFRNQFHDPSMVDSLDFYIPEDYMRRSRLFGNLQDELTSYDLHSELSGVNVPTLLVYGEMEPAVLLSGARLDSLMPDSRMEVISDAGHFPFIEEPKAFTRVVRTFLKKHR